METWKHGKMGKWKHGRNMFLHQDSILLFHHNSMEHQHPGKMIQLELTSRGLTQKNFATMIGKKISEVNELIKGKRNITVQWDILLSIVFDHPEQKWIKHQNDFDYGVAKANMTTKIKEVQSKKKKIKGHEVFEDF